MIKNKKIAVMSRGTSYMLKWDKTSEIIGSIDYPGLKNLFNQLRMIIKKTEAAKDVEAGNKEMVINNG